jgi:hypothetical protein
MALLMSCRAERLPTDAETPGKAPALYTTDDLEVFPSSHNFGDVEVGTSMSGVVTVMNLGATDVDLEATILGSADFAITSSVPASIGPGSVVDIALEFAPSAEGLAAADLLINGETGSSLSGVGVAVGPPPPVAVADILAFFDASVADGTLFGSGPGNSADGRRRALRNMIEAAGEMIDGGLIDDACQQLLDTYRRTDGLPRPPEFVAGPAAPTLAAMILDLMSGGLGCDASSM